MDGQELESFAKWLNLDAEWLEHVRQEAFACGCSIIDYTYPAYCPYYKAKSERDRAEADLKRAQEEYERQTKIKAEKKVEKKVEAGTHQNPDRSTAWKDET
jgi:hypothetical protein